MKISNSKKQLAKIIRENEGWCDGFSFAAQDGDDHAVWFYDTRPVKGSDRWWRATGDCVLEIEYEALITNWHQTILSRDEYFHLYPVAETALEPVSEAKPTIEQLAADYRNRKDYADRKQQEADAAKADAEVKLAELVAAGKAIGLALSVACAVHEPLITDVGDLLVGDEVRCVNPNGGLVEAGSVGVVVDVRGGKFYSDFPEQSRYAYLSSHLKRGDVVFIRRPTQGDANA